MTNWNQIVFVTKLLLVKDSCNMGANNTITTASSSSSGAPRRPTSFLTRNSCLSSNDRHIYSEGSGEVEQAFKALVQHVCVKTPDKADYRHRLAKVRRTQTRCSSSPWCLCVCDVIEAHC